MVLGVSSMWMQHYFEPLLRQQVWTQPETCAFLAILLFEGRGSGSFTNFFVFFFAFWKCVIKSLWCSTDKNNRALWATPLDSERLQGPQPFFFLINFTFTHICINILEFCLVLTDLQYYMYIKITRNPVDFFSPWKRWKYCKDSWHII